jgi:hypothetical protein
MFESKADLARAMAAGAFRRRRVMGQSRKFVTAIIKPVRLEAVLETLARVGIPCIHGDRNQRL